MKSAAENKKLSLTECKKILNTDGLFYTDEEIIVLRDYLYHLADIVMDDIAEQENKKLIDTLETKNKGKP
jgi:hypothetical protein